MISGYHVRFRTSEVQVYLRREVPQQYRAATARGMNKSIAQVRTAAVRAIGQVRNVRAKDIRGTMTVIPATRSRLVATLRSAGAPITLKAYAARVVGRRGRGNRTTRNAPVQVEVIRGQKKIVTGAFIGPGGHVFKRAGPKRLPIEKLFGPSIPTAMVRDEVNSAMQNVAASKTPALIEHEMVREFERAVPRLLS